MIFCFKKPDHRLSIPGRGDYENKRTIKYYSPFSSKSDVFVNEIDIVKLVMNNEWRLFMNIYIANNKKNSTIRNVQKYKK